MKSSQKNIIAKIIVFTIWFIFACVIFNIIILQKPQQPTTNKNNIPEYSDTNYMYLIKNFEGKIAIFEKESKTPFKITSVLVSNLPKKDQEILKQGIKIENQKELKAILEDYCS